MATSTDELLAYPFHGATGLEVEPIYRELQQKGPIKVTFPFGEPVWLATRYEDCKMVYGDRRFMRSLGLEHDMPGMFDGALIKNPDLLLNMDPPEQTRIRRLASGAFSPSRIAKLEAQVQGHVDDLWDDVEAAGKGADFMSLFAPKLPARVMSDILGVPKDEAEEFARLVDDLVGPGIPDEVRGAAHVRIHDFITGLIASRRESPTDDLLQVLVEARDGGDRLTESELESLALGLWLGGVDTTHYEVGSMVFALMSHPDRWQEVLDDQSLIPAALEELWRWIPSHKYGVFFPRWASEDLELPSGQLIKAGEPVYPEHTVANRDESVFPNGWEIDFHRVDPQPHLTFAHGAHHCMGSHLARLEIRLAMTTMIQRFPTLELTIAPEEIEWEPTSMLRGAKALPLTW
ncbi:MAG TPA: cytochrome P450 [Acidimicrobiales bacterium]